MVKQNIKTALFTAPAATQLYLGGMPPGKNYTLADLYSGIARMLGRELSTNDKASIRCRHEREAHECRSPVGDAGAGARVLFAVTKRGGLCPAEVWAEAGGDPNRRAAGNYVRVRDGSHDLVFWWKRDHDIRRWGPKGDAALEPRAR